MQLYAGTSGYSYKEWKGPFYPEKLANTKLLGYYAEQLTTVEINNTFYRLPKENVVANWAEQVPDGFVFAIKASQRITHRSRLKDAGETVDYLWKTVAALGDHLGPILFQLPPNLKQDMDRLNAFLEVLPEGMQPVFEFRHESWNNDETYDALRGAGAALCTADMDEGDDPDLVSTANWGYLRLRRSDYDDDALKRWVDRVREHDWEKVFVFFKHEDQGFAPLMAQRFTAAFKGD